MQPPPRVQTLALIGNPNTGKTTLFNALTGRSQQAGNYPGVTVEHKVGTLTLATGTTSELVDLPGTYSLAAHSPDEMLAVDVLLGQQQDAPPLDGILAIVDASNLRRNLYLVSQLAETDLPMGIGALFEFGDEDHEASSKDQIIRDITEAVREQIKDYPLAFFLDDIQWADQDSLDLLERMINKLSQSSHNNSLVFILGARNEDPISYYFNEPPPFPAEKIELK